MTRESKELPIKSCAHSGWRCPRLRRRLAAAFFERMRSNVEFTEAVLKALIEDLVRDLVRH